MKATLSCAMWLLVGCAGEDGMDGMNGMNATVVAGDGLTLTGDTLGVDDSVVRQSSTGDLTIAGAYKYATAKPSTLMIGAPAFVPRFPKNSLVDYLGGQGLSIGFASAGNESLLAPVHLPQNAKVTGMKCQVRDDDASASFTVSSAGLSSTAMSTGTVTPAISMSINTTGAPGIVTTDATVTPFTIDNASNYYSINVLYNVTSAPSNNLTLQFMGCQIAYEIDGPT